MPDDPIFVCPIDCAHYHQGGFCDIEEYEKCRLVFEKKELKKKLHTLQQEKDGLDEFQGYDVNEIKEMNRHIKKLEHENLRLQETIEEGKLQYSSSLDNLGLEKTELQAQISDAKEYEKYCESKISNYEDMLRDNDKQIDQMKNCQNCQFGPSPFDNDAWKCKYCKRYINYNIMDNWLLKEAQP